MMELIKEASDLQVQQVNLIGGEIFLHKDWKIILKELVKRGIAPEFITTIKHFTNKLYRKQGIRELFKFHWMPFIPKY